MYDACMYIWSSILVHVCMMHIPLILTHVIMMHVCMMHISMIIILCMHVINILDPDACVYDAHIYDPGPWSWSMHVCVVHVSMMRYFLGTNGRTDEQGDSRSRMLDPDTCMYDAYIYVPRSLILIHACMMHKAMILALDPEACMYAWCIYVWFWSLILNVWCM